MWVRVCSSVPASARLAPIRRRPGFVANEGFAPALLVALAVSRQQGAGCICSGNRNGRVANRLSQKIIISAATGSPHSSTGVLSRSFHNGKRLMVEDFYVSAAIRSAAKIPRIRAQVLLRPKQPAASARRLTSARADLVPAFNNALFAIVGNQQPGRITASSCSRPMDGMDAPAIAAGRSAPERPARCRSRSPEYAG